MSDQPSWLDNEDNPFQDEGAPAAAPPAPSSNAPSWQTSPEAQQAAAAAANNPYVQQAAQDAAMGVANQALDQHTTKLSWREMPHLWIAMRVLNILITLPLAWVAWVKAFDSSGGNFDTVVVAMYVVLFAVLICCFESCSSIKAIASALAKFFGFMYSIPGRLLFLVMTGFLCISMGNTAGIAIASVVFALAFYNVFVMCKYPEWTKQTRDEHLSALAELESV